MSNKMEREDNQEEEELPSTYYIQRNKSSCGIYPKNPVFNSCNLSLSFIPSFEAGGEVPITINAWHNDLVLCGSTIPKEIELYLCNPRTKQWIKLPPPSFRKRPYVAGFIYDPYYRVEKQKQSGSVTFNTCSRYSVCYGVLNGSLLTRLEVEIFSSETRFWRKAVLVSPKRFDYLTDEYIGSFTYNNMIHFSGHRGIIGFDSYKITDDGVINGHFIERPHYATCSEYSSVAFEVYRGRIRMIEYCARYISQPQPINIAQVCIEPTQNNIAYNLKLWELKNYDTGEWSLEHVVCLHDLVSESSTLSEYIKRGIPNSWVVCFHPYDAHTVLLKLPYRIVECNMVERSLKSVCSIQKYWRYYRFSLLWWPSPLSETI